MEFHDFHSGIDLARRKGHSWTPAEYFREVERQILAQRNDKHQQDVELNRFRAEVAWLKLGRPYYKVWPAMIPLLTNVGVDLPATYLQLPFPAFIIRLPKTDNGLAVDDQHPVQTILAIEGVGHDDERVIMLWTDIGEREPGGTPMLHWSRLLCLPGKTIEESFGGTMPRLPGLRMSDSLMQACLRLAVSVCFLSTGMDRLLQADVLSKDVSAYIDAKRSGDEQRAKTIESRAIRHGKHGWNIGQYERLRPLLAPSRAEAVDGECRQALTHQHQRRAHFRALANGRTAFVRQATVRPDLPPPDRAPGYGVRE